MKKRDSHTSRAPRHLSALAHTLDFPPAIRLRFADHVVIIEWLAASANEEGGAEQRRRADTYFGHFWHVVGEGRSVEEDLLVKSVVLGVVSGDADFPRKANRGSRRGVRVNER